MDAWLQTLREYIWPASPGLRRRPSLGESLAALIALLFVALFVGPDLFLYIELSTMLDVLGAALFLFAFAVGFKILFLSLARQLRSVFAPEDLVLLATLPGPKSPRAFWAGLIAFRSFRMYLPVAVSVAVLGVLLAEVLSRL